MTQAQRAYDIYCAACDADAVEPLCYGAWVKAGSPPRP